MLPFTLPVQPASLSRAALTPRRLVLILAAAWSLQTSVAHAQAAPAATGASQQHLSLIHI